MPEIGSNYNCLAVILIGFVSKKDENYYLQVFLTIKMLGGVTLTPLWPFQKCIF